MIPYGVGSFLVFSIGDWICLKLRLYNHNELFSLSKLISVDSLEEIVEINVTIIKGSIDARNSESVKVSLTRDSVIDRSPTFNRSSII